MQFFFIANLKIESKNATNEAHDNRKKTPVICVLMCISTKIVFLHELLSTANIGTQLCLPIVDI